MKQILPLQQVQNINPIQPVVPQYLTALGVDERLGGIENFINPSEHKVYEYDEKSLGYTFIGKIQLFNNVQNLFQSFT